MWALGFIIAAVLIIMLIGALVGLRLAVDVLEKPNYMVHQTGTVAKHNSRAFKL